MFGKQTKGALRDESIDLALNVDRLEDRYLLAADVDVNGDVVKVIGTDDGEDLHVLIDGGTVRVNGVDTGEAALSKLIVSMKDGKDSVVIENGVEITGKTVIKLGEGSNSLEFGGLHNKVKVLGGNEKDAVTLNGGAGLAKNVINLKGGEDTLVLDLHGYIEAFDSGQFDGLDPLSLLNKPPKIKANLGADNDVAYLAYDGTAVTDADVDDLLADNGYTDIDDAIADLTMMADLAGIKIPQVISLNGGSGEDQLSPTDLGTVLDVVGKVKNFEIFAEVT